MDLYVIINFYTGNVICRDGVEDSGKIIYRQYDSKLGKELVVDPFYKSESVPKIEIVDNSGLNQKVKISLDRNENDIGDILEIYYFTSDDTETRKKCSLLNNYKYIKEENSAYFTIDTSGKYSFIVEDSNYVQYPLITKEFDLCNPPDLKDGMTGIYWDESGNEQTITSTNDSKWYDYSEDSLKMANAKTEDGNYWVWIPKFMYLSVENQTSVEFVNGKTLIATNNKSMNNYKIHEAFEENSTGFWISKFQINSENDYIIDMKPGKTLTSITTIEAKNKVQELNFKNQKNYFHLMSESERQAAICLAESNLIEIANDLVHYAGGAPSEDGYKTNTRYSSTGNIYGVYDLITSENEITLSSDNDEEGRFRCVIK